MRKCLKYLLFMLSLATVVSACTKSNVDDTVGKNGGKQVAISFSFDSPHMENMTKGMTDAQEQNIERMYIYLFYNDNRVAKAKFTDIDRDITMNAYTGDVTIYAIANYPSDDDTYAASLETQLDNVKKLSDLQNMVLDMRGIGKAVDIESPGKLPMTGTITTTIVSGANSITLNMEYVCAKISIIVQDNTTEQNMHFIGWDIINAPTKSYMLEHGSAVINGVGTAVDAVNIDNSSDFFSTQEEHPWEEVDVEGGKTMVKETVYLFENRRGGRRSDMTYSSWKAANPSETITEAQFDGYRGKPICSPDKATYMLFCIAYYNSTDNKTYHTEFAVYMGANDTGDYNVERGKSYTYTIKIEDGLNLTTEVMVDKNLEVVAAMPVTVRTSSSLRMDAHPDHRMVSLSASNANVEDVSIEIVDDKYRPCTDVGFSAQWAKLSLLDLSQYQVRQSGDAGLWQQAGIENHFVRGRYIPHKSRRAWLNANGHTYSPPSGITLGTAEDPYPEDDDVLPFDKATYRMCYKITDIPFQSVQNTQTINIYSDEMEYDENAAFTRRAFLKISAKDLNDLNGGLPKEKIIYYQISQCQPLYVGLVVDSYASDNKSTISTQSELEASTEYAPMYIEDIEEFILQIDPNSPLSTQSTKVAQWGYYGTMLYSNITDNDKYRNGYFLTANAVYDNVTRNADDGSQVSWDGSSSHFRAKYGSLNYNTVSNGMITEPTDKYYSGAVTYGNSGTPYYYPVNSSVANKTDVSSFHSVYNASAAWYCHEHNRDMDGDGNISFWEAEWFLPSAHELQQIWVSHETILISVMEYGNGFYLSSTEIDNTHAKAMGFATGYSESDQGFKNKVNVAKRDGSIRCVRKGKNTVK